ncbi:DUF1799 domain-containing protein [Azospirillum sp. A39]|uniref:DUF1799 domain-containing protein n=1 Tax=Azospirillum sp. A39 TaxID=3462279 RepID=UPI004045753C
MGRGGQGNPDRAAAHAPGPGRRLQRGLGGPPRKKLSDAVRYWIGGGEGIGAEELGDLEAFGAPTELVDGLRAEHADAPAFEVHDDCWPSLSLFLDCDTQWSFAEGVPTGLDYARVLAVMRFRRQRPAPGLLADLKVMERTALDAWSEERTRREWHNRSS